MSFAVSSLGDVEQLARALGLVRSDDSFNDDWLSNPGDYLSSALSDDHQREALVALVDELLGGGTRQTDTSGRIWLPLFESADPPVSFFLVVEDAAVDHVRVGVGVRFTSSAPDSISSLHLPLFKAGRNQHTVSEPVLLGQPGGVITFTSEITIDPSAPAPGQAHLRAVGLSLEIPTDGATPDFGVTVTGLQLPGAAAPRNLVLSLARLDELDDVVLDLVLGLIDAQARQAGGPIQAFARVIGLSTGTPIPPLPIEQLVARGVAAIGDWAAAVFSSPAARDAWLLELANLLQNGATVNAGRVELPFGAARVTLGIDVTSGAAGLPVIAPVLGIEIGATSPLARIQASLFRLDLGTSAAVALPSLDASVVAGRSPAGGTPLLVGDPAVDAIRFGIGLDERRRPAATLALLNVRIGSHPPYPLLDLSSPGAVIQSAGQVIGSVLDQVLGPLGPLGDVLRTILGLSVPPGIPGLSAVDFATFLSDPLGAVRGYWRELIVNHADAVPLVLTPLRDLIADAAAIALPISGTGTADDPWTLSLVGPVAVRVSKGTPGNRMEVGLAASYVNDELGERCTRLEADLAVGLLSIDLDGGPCVFLSSISAGLRGRPRGARRAPSELPPMRLSADSVGLVARWTAVTGLRLSFAAPNPAVSLNDGDLPLDIPDLSAGSAALSDAQWDAVEFLAGQLARLTPSSWVRDLVDALGWIPESPALAVDRPRLRLAALVADPQAAILDWATTVVLRESTRVERLLLPVARVLTGSAGSSGSLAGLGTPRDPYRVPLSLLDNTPALALWIEPFGPPLPTITAVTERLIGWRPGMPGLSPSELAHALMRETRAARDVWDIASGRPDSGLGLGDLIERWTGTDGRILAPTIEPAGVAVHLVDDLAFPALSAAVDLAELLPSVPATIVRIAVAASPADSPWTGAPPDRVIDLTAPALAPAAFTPPGAANGEWFVLLGSRSACRLTAGDADGVGGQTARLERVLQPFRSLAGGLALVAEGGAGHAARRAAERIAEIGTLITVGTPFGPVAFSVVNTEPAASTLRLLDALIPIEAPDDPFDADLALGRDLVRGLLSLARSPSSADELAAPADALQAPRASLDLHAVFGTVSAAAASRALTAIVAAGLSSRASARASLASPGTITGAGAGLRLPLAFGAGELTVTGHAAIELAGVDLSALPALRQSRPLSLHLEIRRREGWLIGGPGSSSGQDLRWLEFNMTLPLGDGGQADAEVVLHEPRVFSIARDRWIIRAAGAAGGALEVVTPALPEVGVVLSGVMRELSLDADPGIAAFRTLLELSGVSSPGEGQGGFVATALDSLLHQPDVHVRGLIDSPQTRPALQSALNAIALPMAGVTVDLAERRVQVSLSGTPGTAGLLPWSLTALATARGEHGGELRLGESGSCLRVTLNPLTAVVEWPRFGQAASDVIPLWPAPDLTRLVAELPPVLAANAMRLGLDYLRELDAGAQPVIDAALDAIGLLSGNAGDASRPVRLPLALLSDPVAWFKDRRALGDVTGAFSPARAAAFVDALKPLLDLGGTPGTIELARGVAVAVSGASGVLRLGLTLDGAALTAPPGTAPRLSFGGTFGVDIGASGSVQPVVEAFAGAAGAEPGRQAVHLTLSDTVRLFIRPAAGADISLYPNPPGLGSVAGAALQVLPFVLDELAAMANPPAAADAARVVRAIGDALDLRSGTPLKFDGARLNAWSENPGQRFVDRLPHLLQSVLAELAAAIGPLLPAPLAVSAPSGRLLLQAGPVELDIATAPVGVAVRVNTSGVPFAGTISASISADGTGLKSFTGTVGPASIPVNGVALRPLIAFAVGEGLATPPRIDVGAALDAAGSEAVFARWITTSGAFSLVAREGTDESSAPEGVALALVQITLDVVARFAMQTAAVQALIEKPIPHTTAPDVKVKTLFRGVFLEDVANPSGLDADLFAPALMLGRFMRLLRNVAEAGPTVDVGGGIAIGVRLDGSLVKLTLGVNGRVDLTSTDIRVSLEADSRWIRNGPPAGLAIGFLDIAALRFEPSLTVAGIGIRIGRSSGPLLDSVITLGSIAVHFFADVAASQLSGGVQLQLSGLAVGASGAAGGDNAVAQGLMGDTGSGSNALAPAFSPALAVQKHGPGPVLVSLSAGEGDGPWWLSIQKGFGPLYIEQVGFGVTVRQDQLEKISVLFDGRVSIAGLVAAVDDLQITFTVTSGASPFEASQWTVDLAGLAVSADISGVTLAGGLRKFGTEPDIEYVGMLMARVATYGLSIYGGYGTGVSDGVRFTAFFAFGAVTGPFGGPPAFFLTGVGGGFGINRDLIFPESLSTFGEFVMIKALDTAASASADPMDELLMVRDAFPMRRDRFWFAAGISFTSFALVDGIAVIAVSFGGGFELTLLGLARIALPRPQLRLVSIELGLLARFSTRDGVLWIQAELTENSWLLHESVRLTGGFAYVMWFAGQRAGEFVLTLGGYHPSFHRDGYPNVPRLGFRWQVSSAITIKGENYFALTSEALMAGGALEASARFGPAWATVSFSANAIIYFDPFRYEADARARIAAGVTVDLWLGEVTFSISISATIVVAGPEFHGSASFEVGPVELTVAFGGSAQTRYEPISWDAFVTKYLEAASPGVARVLTATTGKGSLPPGVGATGDESGPADGSAQKPFEVFSEFELALTTTVPASTMTAGAATASRPPGHALGIAPVGDAAMTSAIAVHLFPVATIGNPATDQIGALRLTTATTGAFPIGAWGPVQPRENKKVPEGEVIQALNGAVFASEASLEDTLPEEVAYNQVEAGPRQPLPFVTERDDRARVVAEAQRLTALVPGHLDAAAVYSAARPWLAEAGNSRVALASLQGGRSAPPRLGVLGERMAAQTPRAPVTLATPDVPRVVDVSVSPPRAIAVLAPLARHEVVLRRTTVTSDLPRVLPPSLAEAEGLVESGVPARLVRSTPRAARAGETVVAYRDVPLSRQARMAPAAVDGRGADSAGQDRLRLITSSLLATNRRGAGEQIAAGEVAVLAMPKARRDSGTGPRPALAFKGRARVVMLGAGGTILSESTAAGGRPTIPQGTERIAVWAASPEAGAAMSGLAGWHDGQSLPYVGWATCLCPGGSVYSEDARLRRGPESFQAGWIAAREFLADSRLVTTRFAAAGSTLIVILDEHAPGDTKALFSLAMDGASIERDVRGEETAPVLLSNGSRRVLVYPIALDPGAAGFTVKILREGTVTVAGVMAAVAAPALVVARLAAVAPEAMLDAATANPDEPVSLQFVQPAPRPRRARKGR